SEGDRGEPCWARNTTRPAKRLWKSRSVEKSQTRLFHRAWKSRKERAIPTFPQPRRRRVFGYISNVSTIDPRVTFLNGLTRLRRHTIGCRRSETIWPRHRDRSGLPIRIGGPPDFSHLQESSVHINRTLFSASPEDSGHTRRLQPTS